MAGASLLVSLTWRPKLTANDNERSSTDHLPLRPPWNKDKLVGPKPPLRPGQVWSIRTKLQMEGRVRELALFNLAIDSKLRGCDIVAVRVDDVAPNGYTVDRATVRLAGLSISS